MNLRIPQIFLGKESYNTSSRDPVTARWYTSHRSHLLTESPQHLKSVMDCVREQVKIPLVSFEADKCSAVATEIESGAAAETLSLRCR